MEPLELEAAQRRRLEETTEWARRIRSSLHVLQEAHGDRVHFRPSSAGVAMVGLLHKRPQRGKSGITNLERVAREFHAMFAEHCGEQLTRLIEQVEGYSALIDEHATHFADLFGALLGEAIRFDGPTEKWIVWPAAGANHDPREDELAARRIRVVGYREAAGVYDVRVGRGRFTEDG